ncbi:hypothetical protein ACIBL6_47595 [Streptomyces sp. NPDC050400]|uniref:hypothetical protein n=1 Tax=Streptomyces sp. NPDC050400 TaxID=3365610 RepID=UPI0037B5C6C5
MTHHAYFEVDVPIRHVSSGQRGLHIFTGWAKDAAAAIQAAHAAYDAARAASEAGQEIPYPGPDGWSACGFRPGWELDWPAATARCPHDLFGWPYPPLDEQ